MVAYVEHLKRINTQEASDHQATRLRLLQAQREWNMADGADNSINVNITRRSSTVGGVTQVCITLIRCLEGKGEGCI